MTGRRPDRIPGDESPGRPGPIPVLATVACCATLFACEAGDGGTEVMRRDSAGVKIVETAVATDSAVDLGELRLEIGRIQGPEAYQLHEVASALRLSDGRIVVVNTGTNELRFYDTAGVHLGSTPGTGDGPGEFTDLEDAVRTPGDSLVGYSTFGYRISLFAPEGRYVQELRPSISDAEVLAVRGGLPDGLLVVSGTLGDYSSSALETGLHGPVELWAAVARDGTVRDTLGHLPWARGALYQYHGDGWGMQMIVGFAAAASYDVKNGRVFVGDGQRAEVRTLASDGSVERTLRWDARSRPLTEDFVAAHRERLLEGVEDPDGRRRYEAAIEAFPYPNSLPVFEALEATPAGGLWIQAYSPEHASGAERWWVFDSSGRSLDTVDVPAGFRITDVGREVVLGIHTDEVGVQRVRLYDRPAFPQ